MKTPLIAHLQEMINYTQKGCITFANFMELALYHPQYGYYNTPQFSIGRSGAFMTAPEISPLFAQCFAKQCLQLFPSLGATSILELGAGSGRFAFDILTELDKANALPSQYYIYDVSIGLRKKQQNFLRDACPQFMSRIIWLDQLPDKFQGIIIANEVLDALPVNCFRMDNDGIKEKCVTIDNKNRNFCWKMIDADDDELINHVTRFSHLYELPASYESEINLRLEDFMQTLAETLDEGAILIADYGYGQREYYHPERIKGSIASIYQGQRIEDPLRYPGQQDISAHVDFTRVAEYAFDKGFAIYGFTTQAAFLLGCGLLDLAKEKASNLSPHETFNMQQAMKYLTLPTEMGERIKIMVLFKNISVDKPLIGFHLKDNRREL